MTHAADLGAYMQAINSGTDGIQHVPPEGSLSTHTTHMAKTQRQLITPIMEIFRQGFANRAILAVTEGNSSASWTWQNVQQNVRALHEAGLPILAGTDAVGVVSPDIAVTFGLTLHNELENLVSAGFTPVEALIAATSEPAKRFGLDDRGVIAVGNRADLLLLDADPSEVICNTRRSQECGSAASKSKWSNAVRLAVDSHSVRRRNRESCRGRDEPRGFHVNTQARLASAPSPHSINPKET